MNTKSYSTLLLLSAALVFAASAHAAVLLQTDFAERTVSGDTASNITWTENSLIGPSSMTVNDGFNLFDTTAAQGFFAVERNLATGGPWDTTFTINPLADLTLGSVDITQGNFINSGDFQNSNRSVTWTVDVVGSLSGPIGSVSGTSSNFKSKPL